MDIPIILHSSEYNIISKIKTAHKVQEPKTKQNEIQPDIKLIRVPSADKF